MRVRKISFILALALADCAKVTNTIPNVVTPTDPIRYYDLEVPVGLAIQSVAFDVSTFSVNDTNWIVDGQGPTKVGGRGFLKVYATEKATGEQYLLIYEDVVHRKQPGLVLRFTEQPIPLKSPT